MLIGATNRYLVVHVKNTVNNQVIVLHIINVDGGKNVPDIY